MSTAEPQAPGRGTDRPATNVLVVEADPRAFAIIEEIVMSSGRELIGVARTVDAAMVMIPTRQPDLLVVDIKLGGEPRLVVPYEALQRQLPLVLIGVDDDRDIPEPLRRVPYLGTAFSKEDLRQALENACSSAVNGKGVGAYPGW